MVRRGLVLIAVAIVGLAAAGRAAAATITVNTTFDDLSQGDGQCSLRKAIEDVDSPGSSQTDCAPAAFGANTIVLRSGTYMLGFFDRSDLLIDPTVTGLTIVGGGESRTVINATLMGNRAFEIDAGAAVTISDLTVTNGHAPDGSVGSAGSAGTNGSNGGAILNGGALTLTDTALSDNQAGAGGVGGPGTSSAAGGAGGAGGSGGAIYNTGNLSLTGVTIGGNQAGSGGNGGSGGEGPAGSDGGAGGNGGDGGGVTNAGGTLTSSGSTMRGNSAGSGGAGGGGGSGTSTAGGDGGSGGVGANGGGVSSDAGTISATNSTFASNTAGSGGAGGTGGAGAASGGGGGNGGAGGSGGGVAGATPSGATLLQATAAGNQSGPGGIGGAAGTGASTGTSGSGGDPGSGGGVFDQGAAITLENSLLVTNEPGGNCGGAILDGGYNLGFGDSTCPSGFAVGNPNLGSLQDNGGPAPSIALGQGSAAIDQIPATGAHCPPTDERGVPRPSGSKCDIGAYEVAPPIAATHAATHIKLTGATLNASVTPNAGAASVTFQYGTTTKYGKSTPTQQIGGVTATPASATIKGLKPHTEYHYRVVVTSMDGTAVGRDQTVTTSLAPVISHLKITPRAFSPRHSTKITYTDSATATTTVTVLRCVKIKHGKCTATKRVRRFKHRDAAKTNKVHLKGHGLTRGTYLLELTPRALGRTGRTVSAKLRIT